MANKVTIFGAGSVVFSLGLVKDLCLTKELNGSHICFMDINEEVLDVIYELGRRYAEDLSADMTFEKTTSREVALKDADFVINTATVTHNEYFMQRLAQDDGEARVFLRQDRDARVLQFATDAGCGERYGEAVSRCVDFAGG